MFLPTATFNTFHALLILFVEVKMEKQFIGVYTQGQGARGVTKLNIIPMMTFYYGVILLARTH